MHVRTLLGYGQMFLHAIRLHVCRKYRELAPQIRQCQYIQG